MVCRERDDTGKVEGSTERKEGRAGTGNGQQETRSGGGTMVTAAAAAWGMGDGMH